MANIVEIGSGWESGVAVGKLAVGSIVQLNENNTPTDYIIVHQGLPDPMYDSSCNGTWVLRKDVYNNGPWDTSNTNIYNLSTVNDTLNNLISLYDGNVQNNIMTVKIPYCVGERSDEVLSGANGLSCKLFLLSGYEIGFTSFPSRNLAAEGVKLDYFESDNSTIANNKRIAYLNGQIVSWYLRSPSTSNDTSVWCVFTNGDIITYNSATYSGIRFAAILNPNFIYKI